MKIRSVTANNHKKAFEVLTGSKRYSFPYAQLNVQPSSHDPIRQVYVDEELGREGFTYELSSGKQDTVHIDHVLQYNRDPGYVKDLLLYRLTLAIQRRLKKSPLSKRELIRRLGTSPAQFYRLLDQTNRSKSIGQLLSLLNILDCDVEVVVKDRRKAKRVVASL
jgi:hypothetical protein